MFLITTLMVLSGSALADNPPLPFPYLRCGLGVSYDSYSRGVESVFEDKVLRPKQVDEPCYRLGQDKGRVIRAQAINEEMCVSDFREGQKRGFDVKDLIRNSACLDIGHECGKADLRIGARELKQELVGEACLTEYQRGYVDGAKGDPINSPGDAMPRECYQAGHFDGGQFRAADSANQ